LPQLGRCGLPAGGTSLTKTVNVSTLLDEGRWTGYQKLLIVGTALTIILAVALKGDHGRATSTVTLRSSER